MKEAYIGIDPGKSGFIVVFADGEYQFFSMPTHKVPTGKTTARGKLEMKTEFYDEGLRDLVFEINKLYKNYRLYGIIEEVTGRQGWSAQNNFTFGHTAGLQKMLLIMLNAEIIMVRPQKWQSEMYKDVEKIRKPSSTGKTMVHDTKATSALAAQKLAPNIIFSKQGIRKKDGTTHKIDDNKTDAFLMCIYLFRQITKKGRN